MADYKIQDTTLKAIADSIRSKTGSADEIKVADMASKIEDITVENLCEVINGLYVDLDFSDGDCGFYAPADSLIQSAIIMKPHTLLPENIAKDVEIAGVVGTLEVEQHTMLEDMELELNLAEGNQELSVPDGYAVKSAVIKKPDTLIPENIAEGIEIAGVVGTFKGGGGSVEGFATTTFMNGDTVVYTRPVYIGDDCPDPVTQGRIEAPTKESTAQYDYTHSGWASADGGTADNSVLKNIQGDTVVYSAFAESVRYYTVNFYDGETLLHTEQVAYGNSSDYSYTKDNHLFNGWSPEPTNITSDLDCYGEWEESYTFANASWEYISRMSESGRAAEVFSLGDEKDITVNYADGTSEIVTLHIAGFDALYTNIDLEDNTQHKTAGIALTAKHVLKTTKFFHNGSNEVLNDFTTTSLGVWLNGDFYNALPEDLQSVLKNQYVYHNEYVSEVGSHAPVYTKVFVPTEDNMTWGDSSSLTPSKALKFYNATNSKRIKTTRGSSNPVEYWLDLAPGWGAYANYIKTTGAVANQGGYAAYKYVCPMFAI